MPALADNPVTTAAPELRANIDFPRKMQPLFRPKRYKILKSGRGCAKSWSIARALLLMAAKKQLRILCTREYQTSITESVHQLLNQQIEALGLSSIYEITQKAVRCKRTGSAFIFAGIKTDPKKIKSTEGIDICWVEEAEKVSEESWKFLIPTIRKESSEIWVSFNPDQEDDPTSKRFITNPPPDSIVIELTQSDNPWFPETLQKEMAYDFRTDPEAAAHVWGGQFRKASNAQIFGPKKFPDGSSKPTYVVEEFSPYVVARDGKSKVLKQGWSGPYFGADWGFSPDPATLVKCWLDSTRVYIEYEAYAVAVELTELPALYADIPGAKEHVIRADNSRPETISYMASCCTACGVHSDFHRDDDHQIVPYSVIPASKWPGSVEDGIAWLRAHEQIVIHPRCIHAIEEARLYRKKTDPITGDVLPIIVDKHNHIWDATRYALEPLISQPEREEIIVQDETLSISSDLDEFDFQQSSF